MKKNFKEYFEVIKEYFSDNISNTSQIWEMAKLDIKKTYRGAALGWAWAIIMPMIRLFVYWFAIVIGLRASGSSDFPYFAILITGMVPWFFMSDMLNGGTKVMRKYKFLITKMRFPLTIVPTFFSLSKLLVHFVMVAITIGVLAIMKIYPSVYILQLPFYMMLMYIFFNSWTMFAGMLGAINKDFINLISSITIAFFWLSGILYSADSIDSKVVQDVLSWNPITIIVNGYRDSLLYNTWFWEKPQAMLHFAIIAIIMMFLGTWAYKKLRKDIPDVI